jgi:hypothetical protein
MDNSFDIRKALESIIKEVVTDMDNPYVMDGTIVGYETIDGLEYAVFQPMDTELTSISNIDLPRNPNDGTVSTKPPIGAPVKVTLDSTTGGGFISHFNAIEKIVIAPGDTDHGGLVIVQQCVDKLNEIIDKVNEIDNWANGHRIAYNSHTHPTAPSGPVSTPSSPYTNPKPATLNQVTVADLENPVVKQGNGRPASTQQTTNAEIEAAKKAVDLQQAKVNKLNEKIAELTKKIDRYGDIDAAATNIALNEKVSLMQQAAKEEILLNQALEKLNNAMDKGAKQNY